MDTTERLEGPEQDYGTTNPWPDRGEDLLESCMSLG